MYCTCNFIELESICYLFQIPTRFGHWKWAIKENTGQTKSGNREKKCRITKIKYNINNI